MLNLGNPEIIKFKNQHVLGFQNSPKSSDAFLFLHGFPADKGVKNQDIAYAIYASLKDDVYLIHYTGLGDAPGAFSFSNAVCESIDLGIQLSSIYRRVHLVGHSWGGLVAMNVAEAIGSGVGKVLLLSPLSVLPGEDVARKIIASVLEEYPALFGLKSMEEIISDLDSVGRLFDPKKIASSVSRKCEWIAIWQAKHDEELSVELARDFVRYFDRMPKYREIEQDHRFSVDREDLIRLIVDEFLK